MTLKVGKVATQDFFFPVCLGILISGFRKETVGASLLSGMIWNIGNLLSIFSISLIGLTKGLHITQSASLVAVLWGAFYFKEIAKQKARLQVLVGAIILLVGVAVLSFA